MAEEWVDDPVDVPNCLSYGRDMYGALFFDKVR